MKHQALFSSKDKSKNIKVPSAANLLSAFRVVKFLKYHVEQEKYVNTPNGIVSIGYIRVNACFEGVKIFSYLPALMLSG